MAVARTCTGPPRLRGPANGPSPQPPRSPPARGSWRCRPPRTRIWKGCVRWWTVCRPPV